MLIVFGSINVDLVAREEPAPGGVVAEEARHARRRAHGQTPRVNRLEAELREPQIMADVRVGQEDTVDRGAIDSFRGGT